MEALSEKEILDMEARIRASSPGPWKSMIEGRDHTSGSSFIMVGDPSSRGNDIELMGATTADQDFIASAKQDMPKLINEIRRLRASQFEK
jgi:hypothetical protein